MINKLLICETDWFMPMIVWTTGRVQALVFALSWRIAKLSLQLSKNDACTLLQAGVLSFGADSFTLLILKLLLMF
jgi:hypothetical protein